MKNRRRKASRARHLTLRLRACDVIAAKKETFELEDKFEAAKFEKELLLQVPGRVWLAVCEVGYIRHLLVTRVVYGACSRLSLSLSLSLPFS